MQMPRQLIANAIDMSLEVTPRFVLRSVSVGPKMPNLRALGFCIANIVMIYSKTLCP